MRRRPADIELFRRLASTYGMSESQLVRFALRFLEAEGPIKVDSPQPFTFYKEVVR
jgi:hypothetical protein